MVKDSNLLCDKRSTIVHEFATKLNKIFDMFDEISYFRKKSIRGIWYKFNKTQRQKLYSNLKKNMKNNFCFSL